MTPAIYSAINCYIIEQRMVTINHGGGDWLDNHDDDYIVSRIELRIVHRNGVYKDGEFIGECNELTSWSEKPIDVQMQSIGNDFYLIEIYPSPKMWTGEGLPDYVAIIGKARQLYSIAVPLRNGTVLSGIVSTDGFWEAGKTYQSTVILPFEKERTYIEPTREQSCEMQDIAFHKLNNSGNSYQYYQGEDIAVEPVQGNFGTYYKYPRFNNRFGVGSLIYIIWELDIDIRSAEKILQSEKENLKYL